MTHTAYLTVTKYFRHSDFDFGANVKKKEKKTDAVPDLNSYAIHQFVFSETRSICLPQMNKFGVWRPGKTGTHFALSTIREAVWCGQSHRYNTYGLHRLWFVVVVLVNGIESTPKGSISSFAGLTGTGLGWLLLILSLIFYFIIWFVEW